MSDTAAVRPTRSGIPADIQKLNDRIVRRTEWQQGIISRAVAPLGWLGPRESNTFGILMYHRVAKTVAGTPTPTWNVTPATFRAQLSGLLERGFTPWTLRKALLHQACGQPIPRRVFVVTFDDGYENVYSEALPILRKLGVPATVFLATAFLDSEDPFPFDDWSVAGDSLVEPESWRPLSTSQCRALLASGLVELGAHTHLHEDFRGRPDDLRRDVEQCLTTLLQRFSVQLPAFAFPYGSAEHGFAAADMLTAVQEAGCSCALTTAQARARGDSSPYGWGRFTAYESDTPRVLAAKLDGWYELGRDSLRMAKRLLFRSRAPITASGSEAACRTTFDNGPIGSLTPAQPIESANQSPVVGDASREIDRHAPQLLEVC